MSRPGKMENVPRYLVGSKAPELHTVREKTKNHSLAFTVWEVGDIRLAGFYYLCHICDTFGGCTTIEGCEAAFIENGSAPFSVL